jgi:hypothetical protein
MIETRKFVLVELPLSAEPDLSLDEPVRVFTPRRARTPSSTRRCRYLRSESVSEANLVKGWALTALTGAAKQIPLGDGAGKRRRFPGYYVSVRSLRGHASTASADRASLETRP